MLLGSITFSHAQIVWANTGSATDWYGATNWTPNTGFGSWQTTDIARFNNTGTATTAGIDMSTGSLSIGAITVESRSRNITIGNSAATPGTLTLNGTTVNGIPNVIIYQQGSSIPNHTLTLQDNETGTGKVMNIALGNAVDNAVFGGSLNPVIINSSITGAGKKLTLIGAIEAGQLLLTGANTYTGLTTVNSRHSRLILQRPGGGTLPSTNDVDVADGTLEINSDQTLHNLFVHATTGLLKIGDGATLTITGSLTLSGLDLVVLEGTGKIVYAPGATLEYDHIIGNTTSIELPAVSGPTNITLVNGAHPVLHATRTITGLLSGNLVVLGDNSFRLGDNDFTTGSVSVNSNVITNGTGKLFIPNIGVAPVVFPVGSDIGLNNQTPVTISNGQGLTYGIRVASGITPFIINNNNAVDKTWFIQPSATPVSPVNVSFGYSNTQGNPGFNYATAVELGQYISSWTLVQTNIPQTQPLPTTISTMAGNTENEFVISNIGGVLAQEKIDLAVQKQGDAGYLNWAIETNTTIAKLEIERSANGNRFTNLAAVNTTDIFYADDKLLTGTNYYRLKITDVNGKVTYSTIVALLNKTTGFDIIGLYPSLVNANALLNVTAAQKTKMEVVITDINGKQVERMVYNLAAGSNRFMLNLAHLSAGTYQIKGYTEDGVSKTLRFIKQ